MTAALAGVSAGLRSAAGSEEWVGRLVHVHGTWELDWSERGVVLYGEPRVIISFRCFSRVSSPAFALASVSAGLRSAAGSAEWALGIEHVIKPSREGMKAC